MNRKLSWLISLIIISVSLTFSGCSGSEDSEDSGGAVTAEEQIVYVVGQVFSSIDAIFSNESLNSCVTPPTSTDYSSFSVTYTSCTFSDSDLNVSGMLEFENTIDGSTMTMVMTGNLSMTGGVVLAMEFNLTILIPYDTVNEEPSGDPTSITGTVLAGGTSYDAATLDYSGGSGGGSGSITDPSFVVAGMNPGTVSLIIYSEDGSAWGYPNIAEMSSPAEDLYGIACESTGKCVAVGDNGALFYSSDGTSWTAGSSGITYNLTGVAVGNNRWVAVGSGGIIYSDNDGATETIHDN